MFFARFAEPGLFHPTHAIRSGVIESGGRLDQHVQAHEQTESILGPVVVDDAFINDQRTPARKGFLGFANQELLFFQAPIVQDVPHHNDVSIGERIAEKTPRVKHDARRKAVDGNIILEDGSDLGQVEADS